jgi:flavin-dependent dehydrogenase
MPLLDYLGLSKSFLEAKQIAAGGTLSAWGSDSLQDRSYIFSGRGMGWHVDRSWLDDWLLTQACKEGADCVMVPVPLRSIHRDDSHWHFGEFTCKVLLDASGRSALLPRQHQLPIRDDRLIAEIRWFTHPRSENSSEGALIESVSDGWWYSAFLPAGIGVAMFMTDSDILRASEWHSRLTRAPYTADRLSDWCFVGETAKRPANSQFSPVMFGDSWVAVGDAAVAFDPISAMGIGFAMKSAMEAARVAVAMLDVDSDFAIAYQQSIHNIYADYRRRLLDLYGLERRWLDSPFWARRCAFSRSSHAAQIEEIHQ